MAEVIAIADKGTWAKIYKELLQSRKQPDLKMDQRPLQTPHLKIYTDSN